MKYGLFSVNSYACAEPGTAVRIGRLAEQVGFESLWAGEHVVLPDPRVPPSPMDPDEPILDPLIALSFLGAVTKTVKLGTGIVILPQRNPVVLAKQVSSVDALCGGRLILGVGAGYLEPEMTAIGVPMSERGTRTDEFLAAMRSLWYDDHPAHRGRFVNFSGVQAHPRPGPIPIVVGGRTPAAYRRAVEQCHGWYGFALTVDGARECIDGLDEARARFERPRELGGLEISVSPRGTPDPDAVARFEEMGVARLILVPSKDEDSNSLAEFVARVGDTLIGHAS